jgi:hypothetical protein
MHILRQTATLNRTLNSNETFLRAHSDGILTWAEAGSESIQLQTSSLEGWRKAEGIHSDFVNLRVPMRTTLIRLLTDSYCAHWRDAVKTTVNKECRPFCQGKSQEEPKLSQASHRGCPSSSVRQRSMMSHHTYDIGGFKTRAVDDY